MGRGNQLKRQNPKRGNPEKNSNNRPTVEGCITQTGKARSKNMDLQIHTMVPASHQMERQKILENWRVEIKKKPVLKRTI